MPQTADLPRPELVIRGDFYARCVSVSDFDANPSTRLNIVATAPLYLDARGNTSRGFVLLGEDGNALASLSFDGRLQLKGVAVPLDDSEDIAAISNGANGLFLADISTGTIDTKMYFDLNGNFYFKGGMDYVDSLVIEKVTGTLTVPKVKNVVAAPGGLNVILTSDPTYPFIQTINAAGDCTSKFHVNDGVELVGGYFGNVEESDSENFIYGSIKF